MNKKLNICIVLLLVVVLWFTFVSSVIDTFRMSFAIIDLQDYYTSEELSNNLVFFNLTSDLRLEVIQIVIAVGFLLNYYSKKEDDF